MSQAIARNKNGIWDIEVNIKQTSEDFYVSVGHGEEAIFCGFLRHKDETHSWEAWNYLFEDRGSFLSRADAIQTLVAEVGL